MSQVNAEVLTDSAGLALYIFSPTTVSGLPVQVPAQQYGRPSSSQPTSAPQRAQMFSPPFSGATHIQGTDP